MSQNSYRWSDTLTFAVYTCLVNYWQSLIKKSNNSALYKAPFNPACPSDKVAPIKHNSTYALDNFPEGVKVGYSAFS